MPRKKILQIIILFCFVPSLVFGQQEEFFIVTDGPVAVGGGMMRHYITKPDEKLSVRYSFSGIGDNFIFIEKFTKFSNNGQETKEIVKVPIKKNWFGKKGEIQVGTHLVKLKVNKYGRILVKE